MIKIFQNREVTLPRAGIFTLFVLFLIVFLIYPLSNSFTQAWIVEGKFTALYFKLMLSSPGQWEIIANSINIAISTTALVSLIAIPLSVLMVRRNFPLKRFFGSLLLVPLLLPPFVGALGFAQLAGRFGSINLILLKFGIVSAPIDWLGSLKPFGIVLLQALHLFPILYLNVAASLSNINASLEDAAASVGSSKSNTFKSVIFPLIFPAFFASASIVFVASLTDLGTPLLFEYRRVLSVQIYNMLSDIHQNPMGYSVVVFVALLCITAFIASQAVLCGKHLQMGGKGHTRLAQKKIAGVSQLFPTIFVGLLLTLSFLPHIGVLLMAFSDKWFMTVMPESFTFRYFLGVFVHPTTSVSLKNSIFLSVASTILDLVGGFLVAWFLTRTKFPGKNVLEFISILPLAVPGIIFAFGYLSAFTGTFLDARVNPLPLLVIAYGVRKLPYMIRSTTSGFQQASVTLEEAAKTVGASFGTIYKRITIPLVATHLIAGSILCFSFAMLEVSDSLILAMEERYFPVSKALFALTQRPDGVPLACALSVILMVVIAASLWGSAKLVGRDVAEFFKIQ